MKAKGKYRKHHSRGLHIRRGGPAVTVSMKLTPFTKLAVDDEGPTQSSAGSMSLDEKDVAR